MGGAGRPGRTAGYHCGPHKVSLLALYTRMLSMYHTYWSRAHLMKYTISDHRRRNFMSILRIEMWPHGKPPAVQGQLSSQNVVKGLVAATSPDTPEKTI